MTSNSGARARKATAASKAGSEQLPMVTITLNLPPSALAALSELAELHDIDTSAEIRNAISSHLLLFGRSDAMPVRRERTRQRRVTD